MDQQAQYLVAGVGYGVIALFLLACSGTAFYAAFETHREAFVPMCALFGMAGGGLTWACLHCFKCAMQPKLRRW